MRLNLVPAYGRDYKSAKAVKDDWNGGRDFIIKDISSRWDGKAVNKPQLSNNDTVTIRYNKLTKVVVIRPANGG